MGLIGCLIIAFIGTYTVRRVTKGEPQSYFNNSSNQISIANNCEDGWFIIHYANASLLPNIEAVVRAANGRLGVQFQSAQLLTVEMPSALGYQIANLGAKVYPDSKVVACLDQSVPLVKPPAVWAQVEQFFGQAINGSGIKVAVLDTGIEVEHPDLDDLDDNPLTVDPKVILQQSFVEGHPAVDDNNGHGTHIAGIIGGTGNDSQDYTQKGVAPGCYLLNGKVLDANGTGYLSWVLAGIQWALANDADVINLSLVAEESGNGTDPLSLAVDAAVRQGVVVVLAAGTDGAGPYKIGIPAVSKLAITVGASDGNTVAGFSPSGPTYDFRLKPDLLAPGIGIESCDADKSGYVTYSGTSQAAAHVSGAVALLKQVHPSWSTSEIKDALLANARNLNCEPYTQGTGRLDIPSAVNCSLLFPGVVDFTLLGLGLVNRTIILRNLRPYPVTVHYETERFRLNSTSPLAFPPAGVLPVRVSLTTLLLSAGRVSEYINFSVEGRGTHLLATGIQSHISLAIAPNPISYNQSFQANLTLELDRYPVTFLNSSYLEISCDGIQLALIPVKGNGSFSVPLQSSLLHRGSHWMVERLIVNNTYLIGGVLAPLVVHGYPSAIIVPNFTYSQYSPIELRLQSAQNVTGPLLFYLFQGGTWQWVGNRSSPQASLRISGNLAVGVYPLKVVFLGDQYYEPSETMGWLVIQPNYTYIIIPLVIAGVYIVAMMGGYLALRRRKTQRIAEEQIRDTNEPEPGVYEGADYEFLEGT